MTASLQNEPTAFSIHAPQYLRELRARLAQDVLENARARLLREQPAIDELSPHFHVLLEAYVQDEHESEARFLEGFAANWAIPSPDIKTIDLLTQTNKTGSHAAQEFDPYIRTLWDAFDSFFPEGARKVAGPKYRNHIYIFVGLVRQAVRPMPEYALKPKSVQQALINDLETHIRAIEAVSGQFKGVTLYDILMDCEERGNHVAADSLNAPQLQLLADLFANGDALSKILRGLHRLVAGKIKSTRLGPRTVARTHRQRVFMQRLVDHFSTQRFPRTVTNTALYKLVAATTNLALLEEDMPVTAVDVEKRTRRPIRGGD